MRNRVIGVLLCLPLVACASAPLELKPPIDPATLLAGRALQASSPGHEPKRMLAVNDAMHEFLERTVPAGGSDIARLRALAHAIISDGTFGLQYDEQTLSAAETFDRRSGNCLSFSAMFVAMARALDLDARFQEVDIPPDWSVRGGTYVLSRHVNVVVDLGRAGKHVIDFNMADFRSTYDQRSIDDERARAHYYNNLGAAQMQAGNLAGAIQLFRRAVAVDPRGFSPAWTNLGTLYMRASMPQYAKSAYLVALAVDRHDLVAMSNLAGLLERAGDDDRAAAYRSRVTYHRNRNPYYRFRQARDAFDRADYGLARAHLRDAIRQHRKDDRFYFLMSLCYLREGRRDVAQQWLERAEEIAATTQLKRKYASKIDILLGGATSP